MLLVDPFADSPADELLQLVGVGNTIAKRLFDSRRDLRNHVIRTCDPSTANPRA